jgi:hypothetical protein
MDLKKKKKGKFSNDRYSGFQCLRLALSKGHKRARVPSSHLKMETDPVSGTFYNF